MLSALLVKNNNKKALSGLINPDTANFVTC